jgi:hypothetical protein
MNRNWIAAAGLALLLAAGAAAPETAAAQSADDFEWDFTGDFSAAIIKKYKGAAAEVVIPSEVEGIPVREIGDNAFRSNTNVISVTLPDGVTAIGGSAFTWCRKLASVYIPASVTSIGGNAFAYCYKLTSITIEEGAAVTFNANCFSGCKPDVKSQISLKKAGYTGKL